MAGPGSPPSRFVLSFTLAFGLSLLKFESNTVGLSSSSYRPARCDRIVTKTPFWSLRGGLGKRRRSDERSHRRREYDRRRSSSVSYRRRRRGRSVSRSGRRRGRREETREENVPKGSSKKTQQHPPRPTPASHPRPRTASASEATGKQFASEREKDLYYEQGLDLVDKWSKVRVLENGTIEGLGTLEDHFEEGPTKYEERSEDTALSEKEIQFRKRQSAIESSNMRGSYGLPIESDSDNRDLAGYGEKELHVDAYEQFEKRILEEGVGKARDRPPIDAQITDPEADDKRKPRNREIENFLKAESVPDPLTGTHLTLPRFGQQDGQQEARNLERGKKRKDRPHKNDDGNTDEPIPKLMRNLDKSRAERDNNIFHNRPVRGSPLDPATYDRYERMMKAEEEKRGRDGTDEGRGRDKGGTEEGRDRDRGGTGEGRRREERREQWEDNDGKSRFHERRTDARPLESRSDATRDNKGDRGSRPKPVDYANIAVPELNSIQRGTVESIAKFGIFVRLDLYPPPSPLALVHVSQISRQRVENVEDHFSLKDRLWVKVVEISKEKKAPPRISLSYKHVNQETGADRDPNGEIYQMEARRRGGAVRKKAAHIFSAESDPEKISSSPLPEGMVCLHL
ncbi:hypothetical protein AAMO2058_000564900 [Amorphochlora amoebiformis]